MGALGRSQGKRFSLFAPPSSSPHHQAEVVARQPGDAARKGKAERPFRHYKETFLVELEGVALDTRSVPSNLWFTDATGRNDPVPSLGHDGAMDTTQLPAPVKATMAGFLTAELTTVSPRGAPLTWPVLPSVEWETGRIAVLTSIGLPQKAHNIRRRPEVCLLFSDQTGSGLTDPHSVLVEGSARVTDGS